MLTELYTHPAELYGTGVFNLRFSEEISSGQFIESLREADRETVFH